ncbi:hypothetical protein PAXRUDRAFT_611873 [Paxillus rubicundulus Ve08.2h10]|uniref:Unplaced genomic scaffold scaffold_5236, whole genome shotgun sequence n=1 Tax=Paxillus rubicundulus Ve08.2h10 TaxID=930991 RepID=A0A0D0CCC2_9AGAM|nr:hypothetical protein PAXRUDRAFT_611873 [Paxillus rubicundulus Ve08.2h10]
MSIVMIHVTATSTHVSPMIETRRYPSSSDIMLGYKTHSSLRKHLLSNSHFCPSVASSL